MKNTSIHVCAKTAYVGCPSKQGRQISSVHNFLYFSIIFNKCIENMVMVTLTTGIIIRIHTHALLGVEEIVTKVVSVCADCL
jgi:hypothetical protein